MAVAAFITAACSRDGRTLDPAVEPLPGTTQPTVPPGVGTVAPTASPGSQVVPTAAPASGGSQLTPSGLQLVAPWPDDGPIPEDYTCAGLEVSPALSWTNVPSDAVELAVTVTDLDNLLVHWIVTGIAPDTTGMNESEVPGGARQWTNSFGTPAWVGPCPPTGEQHRYLFTVLALNQPLQVADEASDAEVIAALNEVTIQQASVAGVFTRDS